MKMMYSSKSWTSKFFNLSFSSFFFYTFWVVVLVVVFCDALLAYVREWGILVRLGEIDEEWTWVREFCCMWLRVKKMIKWLETDWKMIKWLENWWLSNDWRIYREVMNVTETESSSTVKASVSSVKLPWCKLVRG